MDDAKKTVGRRMVLARYPPNQHPTPHRARSPLRGRKHGRETKNSRVKHLYNPTWGFPLVTETVKNEVEIGLTLRRTTANLCEDHNGGNMGKRG